MSRLKSSGNSGLRFLVEDLRLIKRDFFSYFFLFIQFVYFSGLIRQFGTDGFLVLNILGTLLLCILNNRITEKALKVILISLLLFVLINLISSFVFGFNQRLFAGYLGRIFLGYLIVLFFKDGFYIKFEKLVTVLALISIPLFIIQIITPGFFNLFESISNSVLSEERSGQMYPNSEGHKYLFIFLVNSWGVLRNSGFMWEPAAFGAVLIWAVIFNLIRNKYSANKRLYILLTAAFTTFSIGTYVYLVGIFLVLVIINRQSTFFKILLFTGIIILGISRMDFYSKNLEMMTDKIESEAEHLESARTGRASEDEISRLASFEINLKYFLVWPFGYGLGVDTVGDLKYLGKSPNGFMKILVTWGIFGIILIIGSVLKLMEYLLLFYNNKVTWISRLGLTILFLLPISGNTLYNQPLLFSLILGYWVLQKNQNTLNTNNVYNNKYILS